MASWDTPVVAAPTAKDYAPPVVNFSGIGNLLEDFVKGRQMGREEDKANAFRNGIPRDSNGDPDFNKISDTAAKVGGIDYALPLLNLQIQRDAGAGNAAAVSQAQGVATGQPPQQPSALQRPQASQRPGAGPTQPPAAPAAAAQPTVMTILAAQGIPNDQLEAAAASVSRQLGVAPTDPIDTKNTQVRNVLGPAIQRIKGIGQVVQPQGQPAASVAPTAQPQAAPVASQPQPQPQAQPAATDQNPVSSGDMATADRLDLAAAGLRSRAAATANLNPKGSEGLLKQADAYSDRAKQIREQVGTSNQPAPSIKEWRQSGSKLPYDEWVAGAEGAKETAKEDAKAYSKKYEQFVENGIKSQQEIPQLQMLQEQMNDPNFFSGSGEKYNLLYKRLKSAVGLDPDAAVPQELLRKVTASNVLGSLGQLKGLGPVRVAEMNMAREAAASPDNSIPANKLLVEISKRTHQVNAELADMAQRYKDENGSLDAGFDKKVSSYYKQHPMFTDAEIKDYGLALGRAAKEQPSAKPAAAQMPTFATPGAVHAANLPSGTQFKDANGVVRMVP